MESEVGVLSYFLLSLNVFFFAYLAVTAPALYTTLTQEDNWVENLTVVWFLLAGILLWITALAERNFPRRWIYVLGGIALVFVAG